MEMERKNRYSENKLIIDNFLNRQFKPQMKYILSANRWSYLSYWYVSAATLVIISQYSISAFYITAQQTFVEKINILY